VRPLHAACRARGLDVIGGTASRTTGSERCRRQDLGALAVGYSRHARSPWRASSDERSNVSSHHDIIRILFQRLRACSECKRPRRRNQAPKALGSSCEGLIVSFDVLSRWHGAKFASLRRAAKVYLSSMLDSVDFTPRCIPPATFRVLARWRVLSGLGHNVEYAHGLSAHAPSGGRFCLPVASAGSHSQRHAPPWSALLPTA